MSLKDPQAQLQCQRFSKLSILKPVAGILPFLFFAAWAFFKDEVRGNDEGSLFQEILSFGWIAILIAIVGFAVVVIVILIFGYFQWKRKEFAFSADAVHLRSGIFVKSNDSLPYKRIQTVEIERTIFDRIVGMGSLKIDTGADSDEAMQLGLLPHEKLAPLRSWLLAASNASRQGITIPMPPVEYAGNFSYSASMEASVTPDTVAAGVPALNTAPTLNTVPVVNPEQTSPDDILIYRLGVQKLILSKLINFGLWGVIGAILAIVATTLTEGFATIPFLFAAIGLVTSAFSSVSKQWGTRLYISENGVRLRAGLTTVTSRTITPERVHLITIERGLIMRLLRMWSLSVTYPGMDADSDDAEESLAIVPLGTRADIERVLWVFANNLGMGNPSALLDECMLARKQLERRRIGSLDGVRFASFASEHVRRINPFSWRWGAIVCTDEVAIKRSRTLLSDSIGVLFHEHWQSISVSQGPLARKLRVADLQIGLVQGSFMLSNYSEVEMSEAVDELRRFSQERRAASLSLSSRGNEALNVWHERCQVVAPTLAIPEK